MLRQGGSQSFGEVWESERYVARRRSWRIIPGETDTQEANWYTERYFEALKDAQIRGYLFQQQNYIPGDK